MKRLDQDTAQALTQLRSSPGFEVFTQYLRDTLEEKRSRLVHCDIDEFPMLQGKAALLESLLEKIEKAPDVLNNIKGKGGIR